MKEIKLRLEFSDLAVLDREAQARGITRSELLRERVLSAPKTGKFDTARFNRLLADSQRYMQGHVDRRQVETLVSYVFNKIANG